MGLQEKYCSEWTPLDSLKQISKLDWSGWAKCDLETLKCEVRISWGKHVDQVKIILIIIWKNQINSNFWPNLKICNGHPLGTWFYEIHVAEFTIVIADAPSSDKVTLRDFNPETNFLWSSERLSELDRAYTQLDWSDKR